MKNYKKRKCIIIGTSRGFITPPENEEPTIGEYYNLTIKEANP